MDDVIAKYKNFTAKWNGIMGNDHLPRLVYNHSFIRFDSSTVKSRFLTPLPVFFYLSVGEFQHLISESSGFIFYGTERYLGCLPPNMLAPMNVTGTPCVCCLKENCLLI